MITIYNNEPICLVDLSYFIFYRYFAIQKWLKMSDSVLTQEEMLTKFGKVFHDHLKNITKKLKIKPCNIILVGDCRREDIWRNDIYSKYKQRESTINSEIFPYVYNTIIPFLKEIQFIRSDRLEADDVAFVLTNHLKNSIVIITNDNDYLQMINEKTQIVNLPNFKDITSRCKGSARVGLLTKVLGGDPSDTIDGVVSKKVTTLLLEKTEEEINDYMIENGLKEKYDLNLTLIDMKFIPDHLQKQVTDKVSIVYENEP